MGKLLIEKTCDPKSESVCNGCLYLTWQEYGVTPYCNLFQRTINYKYLASEVDRLSECVEAEKRASKATPKLGRSQKAVLAYLETNPAVTAQEVGDALYSEHSSYGIYKTIAERPDIRRNWAKRILRDLARKKLTVQEGTTWRMR